MQEKAAKLQALFDLNQDQRISANREKIDELRLNDIQFDFLAYDILSSQM